MPTIAVEVTEEDAASHGAPTVPGLLAMLAEGAAMVVRRPGSWEGSNMAQVLRGHGCL